MFEGSGQATEIGDGMIVTGARYRFGNYEWGMGSLYNQLIQNFVPGGLIGYELKDSLRSGVGVSQDWVTEAYGIPVAFYTAKSGYEDLFSQFSFFGCVVLYFIGRGFRKVHDAAVDDHDGRAVIFLCFFIWFPASIAYGALTGAVVLAIPQLALMLFSFRWCIVRPKAYRRIQSSGSVVATMELGRIQVR
jgi:hypothetical protein